jgi:acyl-CoA thioester hydrolase
VRSGSREVHSQAMFSKRFMAGWGDMDFNAHMRNTAFLDRAADTRMLFFAEHGFPMAEFVRRRIGPVILKDELEYFREVALLEEFDVTLAVAGLAPDGTRFLIRNEFLGTDGRMRARVTSAGGWLDLDARRLTLPPPALLEALRALPRTADYVDIQKGRKGEA